MIVALGAADMAGLEAGWTQETLLLLVLSETVAAVFAAVMYFTAHRTSQKLESVERWIDSLEDVAFIGMGTRGEIRNWTPGATKVTGLAPKDALGRSFAGLFAEQDQTLEVPANLLRIAAGNGSAEHSAWTQRPDGTEYWARFLVTAIRGELRRVRGYSVVIHDDTARKRALDHISNQHQLLETVVNGTFDVIFLKDRDGRYQLVNAAGALTFGKRRDEVEGRTDNDIFDAAECRRRQRSDLEVIENGTAQVFEESIQVGGTLRTFLTNKSPWRDHQGNVLGVIGIATDITERKRREEIERSLAEYRGLFLDAPVAYHEIDAEGVIRNVNRAECDLLGRKPSELIGKPVWRFVAPQERSEAVADVRRRLSGFSADAPFERTYLRADGTPVRVVIHEARILSHDGKAVGIRSALLASPAASPLPGGDLLEAEAGIAAAV
jgi:PAS domain S-box-containing protein